MPRRSKHAVAVEALLSRSDGPLSADEAHRVLTDGGTSIGIATVYRLLRKGEEDGLFQAVVVPNGPARYEMAALPHHHHFECLGCRRVYDIQGCPGHFDRFVPEGFALESHDLLLHGRCATCGETAAA